jgi:hypothetical protein
MRLLVVSDLHYAGDSEQARRGWERRVIAHPVLRAAAGLYRRFLWLRDPTAHNHRLDAFLARAGGADLVVANGDYSCDSAFVGVADDAACASAAECLGRLRAALGPRLLAVIGDHELGKQSLFGGAGGLRLRSWERATGELGLVPVWRADLPGWSLVGVTSTLAALPVLEHEALAAERPAWAALRAAHFAALAAGLESLPAGNRWLLFCHDPTALPYLLGLPAVRAALPRLAATIIGHLHSELILRTGGWLAGMPELRRCGATARRLSGALRRAREWRPFRVTLCPSTAGIELLKDGGYLELELPAAGHAPLQIRRHHLPWAEARRDPGAG